MSGRFIRRLPAPAALALAVLTLGLVALALSALAPRPASAVPETTITLEATARSDHFTVRAYRQKTAEQTLGWAEQAWDQLAPNFVQLPSRPIVIVVIEDREEYERIQPAPMTRGFAMFGGRQIYLLGPQLDREVVAHELVHILLGYNVEPALEVPDWFNEGLAQYASGAGRPTIELMYSASSGALLPLSDLDRVDALDGPQRELATIEGLAVVAFLVDSYGDPQLWSLVRRLSTATSFDEAVYDTYGQTDAQLSQQWMAYARDNYSLLSPGGLRLMGAFALALLSVVAASIWFARRSVLLSHRDAAASLTLSEIAAADAFERAAATEPRSMAEVVQLETPVGDGPAEPARDSAEKAAPDGAEAAAEPTSPRAGRFDSLQPPP